MTSHVSERSVKLMSLPLMLPSILCHKLAYTRRAEATHAKIYTPCISIGTASAHAHSARTATDATEERKMNVPTHLSHGPKSTDESGDENLS